MSYKIYNNSVIDWNGFLGEVFGFYKANCPLGCDST
jgi:hypothetical protein